MSSEDPAAWVRETAERLFLCTANCTHYKHDYGSHTKQREKIAAALLAAEQRGREQAANEALDEIDKGGDDGTKATRTAWNMACIRVAQKIRQSATCELEATVPGTWPWALEQMKAGKAVFRSSLGQCAHPITADLFQTLHNGESLIYWVPPTAGDTWASSISDFEATDWQLAEETLNERRD